MKNTTAHAKGKKLVKQIAKKTYSNPIDRLIMILSIMGKLILTIFVFCFLRIIRVRHFAFSCVGYCIRANSDNVSVFVR